MLSIWQISGEALATLSEDEVLATCPKRSAFRLTIPCKASVLACVREWTQPITQESKRKCRFRSLRCSERVLTHSLFASFWKLKDQHVKAKVVESSPPVTTSCLPVQGHCTHPWRFSEGIEDPLPAFTRLFRSSSIYLQDGNNLAFHKFKERKFR